MYENVSYRADTPTIKVISLVGLIFFTTCGILAGHSRQYDAILGFVLFDALILTGLLNTGTVEINSRSIAIDTMLGRNEMDWTEVISVEEKSGNIVFFGTDKWLAVPSFEFWAGPDRKRAIEFLANRLQERNLRMKTTLRAVVPFSHNCKR